MKKTMKSVICLAIAVLLAVFCFAGCSQNDDVNEPAGDTEAKVFTIGVIQLMKHEALDAATQGFVDAVKADLGEENVKVDVQVAGTPDNCPTIANAFVSQGVDLIMANATPALQSAMAATNEIPIVATSITSYGVAIDDENFDGKTGINVTGTADLAPLDRQAAMVQEICPDVKSVGVIYCSSEANSLYQVQEISKYLEELGIKATSYSFSDSNDIQAIVTKAVGENDALYVPTDNVAAENTGIIDAVARPAKVPVFASEEGILKGCGIVTLTIKYYDIGAQAGKMAAEILKDGKNPAEMEIQYAPEFTKKYNPTICEELGITVPDTYEAIAD